MSDAPEGFDLGKLMNAAKSFKEKLGNVQEKLERVTVEAQSGGGMVTVKANAHGEVLQITIDAEACDPKDVEMLQDLIVAAVNAALKKAREKAQEEMQGEVFRVAGIPLGGLFK
jgi:hypothetical protein